MKILSASPEGPPGAAAVVLAAAAVYLFAVRRRAPRPLGVAAVAVGVLGVQAAQMVLWLNWGFPDTWFAGQIGRPVPDVLDVTNAFRGVCLVACLVALTWSVTADRRPWGGP